MEMYFMTLWFRFVDFGVLKVDDRCVIKTINLGYNNENIEIITSCHSLIDKYGYDLY